MSQAEFDNHEEYGREIEEAKQQNRKFANDHEIPHITLEVIHDQDWFTPLKQTATSFEMMINTLLIKFATTRNDDYIDFIGGITSIVDNFHAMVMAISMREAGIDPHESEHEHSQIADIPNAFLDAFKKDDTK